MHSDGRSQTVANLPGADCRSRPPSTLSCQSICELICPRPSICSMRGKPNFTVLLSPAERRLPDVKGLAQ